MRNQQLNKSTTQQVNNCPIFDQYLLFMVDSKQILVYLSLNKDRFKKDYHLIRIGVFGSVARGEQNETSDIDLIVEFEENTPDLYAVKQRIKDEIQSKFNTSVDICREKYIKPVFKDLVLSEVKYA